MSDSEQSYPLHQGRRDDGEHRHNLGHFEPPNEEGAAKGEPTAEEQERRQRMHQRERVERPVLPRGRFGRALIVGVVVGILCSGQAILITFLNTSTYRDAAKTTVANAGTLAALVVGLACLTFFISALLCLIGGFISGKIAVTRPLGILTGFVGGALYYALAFFLVRYIPGYPGNIQASANGGAAGTTAGIIVSLVFLLVVGAIGGLFGWLGAWLATRRHPYYVGYAG